jgi:glycosyltransferase involved in cell wall biosynthesis
VANPSVSVCMPVYNGERFLRDAIESVLAQDHDDFELIVTDDASSDGSRDIVRSFHDPRLRFYQNEISLGIPGAWNMALSKATGRYIKYLFQDDVMYPQCLSVMLDSLRRHESTGIVFSRRDVKEEDGIRAIDLYLYFKDLQAPLRRDHEMECFQSGKQFLETCILHGGLFCNLIAEPSFVMFDSELVNRIGSFDNRLRQNVDYEYWLRLLLVTDACFIDKPLGYFRLHGKSESSSGNKMHAKLRYLWEERVIIDNLISLAKRENASSVVELLNSRQKWFYVYRFRFFLGQRLARMARRIREPE